MVLKPGDVVEVRESSREINKVLAGIESAKRRETPDWIETDHQNKKGKVKDRPARTQVSLPVEENMIVEYYSR